MKEKCGCVVIVDPKTQFETIKPCNKHNQAKQFEKYMKDYSQQYKFITRFKNDRVYYRTLEIMHYFTITIVILFLLIIVFDLGRMYGQQEIFSVCMQKLKQIEGWLK